MQAHTPKRRVFPSLLVRGAHSAFLAMLSLTAVGFAAPPPATKRMAAFILPMDKAAESQTLLVEGYVNESLGEYQGVSLKTSQDLFGMPPDDEANAAFKRAEASYVDSKASFDARKFDEAEKKLKTTLKDFEKAGAALLSCGHLCETIAMYASVLQARGEAEEAKLLLLDLISLQANFELDKKRFTQDFMALRNQVSSSRNAHLRGNVNVKSRPLGAKVFLNNELKGYTPMTLQTLPVGKALVRLERPGFKRAGVVVEVSPEDQDVSVDLYATGAYKTFDSLTDQLAGESSKDKGGTTMGNVARTMNLDRALIGVLKQLDDGKSELALSYFDFKTMKRLATKRAVFQGDEYGQLKGEINRLVSGVMNGADSTEKVSRSGDPLDRKAGTEEWNGDDKGGRGQTKQKQKKSKDPLDGVSGTEDW